ncbi:hypothetical protein AB1L30_24800 [Bremerella sp. JC817]|uniref:hypothetical protein n=1 Tax=Bremerella sp. JC817 TaxID=3231756 RepID=UPI003459EB76
MSKPGTRDRRRQFWVDPEVQGGLAMRVAMYWMICLLSVGAVMIIGAALGDLNSPVTAASSALWNYFIPSAVVSLFVLPIMILDSIRHSNRFVGAIARFKKAMTRLADGETASPLILREGDAWKCLAEQYNRIALRLEELESAQNEPTTEASSTKKEEALST